MTSNRAVNVEALRAALEDIADRADELLAVTGDGLYPTLQDDLAQLGQDLTDLGWELAHAAPALEILSGLGFRLYRRAAALAEVNGLPAPDVQAYYPVSSVGKLHLGPRFSDRGLRPAVGDDDPGDDDTPF